MCDPSARGRPNTKEEAHTTLFSAAIHPPSVPLTHAHLSRQLLLLLGIEFNLDRRHESHFLIRCVAAFRCVTVSQLRGIEVGCLPVSHPHMDATYAAAAIHSRAPCNLHF